jgi:hypothetical protein
MSGADGFFAACQHSSSSPDRQLASSPTSSQKGSGSPKSGARRELGKSMQKSQFGKMVSFNYCSFTEEDGQRASRNGLLIEIIWCKVAAFSSEQAPRGRLGVVVATRLPEALPFYCYDPAYQCVNRSRREAEAPNRSASRLRRTGHQNLRTLKTFKRFSL